MEGPNHQLETVKLRTNWANLCDVTQLSPGFNQRRGAHIHENGLGGLIDGHIDEPMTIGGLVVNALPDAALAALNTLNDMVSVRGEKEKKNGSTIASPPVSSPDSPPSSRSVASGSWGRRMRRY